MSRTHHDRPAGVARRLQVPAHGICAASAQSRHVLDEHPAWAKLADDAGEFPPESAPVPGEPDAPARRRDVLAGEAPGDEVDGLKVCGPGESDIASAVHIGPVSGEDVLTVRLPLDLPPHGEARALEAERHAPDAREEIAACHGHGRRS